MTKLEHPLYLTVRYVDPDRLTCPVKDCDNEGKEENRVDTPRIAELGALTVYLCDKHAGELAWMLLDKRAFPDDIEWGEPEATSPDIPYASPARPSEAGALFAFMGWLTSRDEVSGPFSSHHEASQAAQLVGQFIRMQGWQEPPDGWWHSIKPYTEEEKEALGRVHMENYRAHIEPVSELEDISYGHAPLEEA
jgi:hypothetical protein